MDPLNPIPTEHLQFLANQRVDMGTDPGPPVTKEYVDQQILIATLPLTDLQNRVQTTETDLYWMAQRVDRLETFHTITGS